MQISNVARNVVSGVFSRGAPFDIANRKAPSLEHTRHPFTIDFGKPKFAKVARQLHTVSLAVNDNFNPQTPFSDSSLCIVVVSVSRAAHGARMRLRMQKFIPVVFCLALGYLTSVRDS